jgi:hypothetical protein
VVDLFTKLQMTPADVKEFPRNWRDCLPDKSMLELVDSCLKPGSSCVLDNLNERSSQHYQRIGSSNTTQSNSMMSIMLASRVHEHRPPVGEPTDAKTISPAVFFNTPEEEQQLKDVFALLCCNYAREHMEFFQQCSYDRYLTHAMWHEMNSIATKTLILGVTKHNEQVKRDMADLIFKVSQLIARNKFGEALDTMVVFGDLLTKLISDNAKEESFMEHNNPVVRALYFAHCLFHQSFATYGIKLLRLGNNASSSTQGTFWNLVNLLNRTDVKPDATKSIAGWEDLFETLTPALVVSWIMNDLKCPLQNGTPGEFTAPPGIDSLSPDAQKSALQEAKKTLLEASVKRLVDGVFAQNDTQNHVAVCRGLPPINEMIDDTTSSCDFICKSCDLLYSTRLGAVRHVLECHPPWEGDLTPVPLTDNSTDQINRYYNVLLCEALTSQVQPNLTRCGDGNRTNLMQKLVLLDLTAAVDSLETARRAHGSTPQLTQAEAKALRRHGPTLYKNGVARGILTMKTAGASAGCF